MLNASLGLANKTKIKAYSLQDESQETVQAQTQQLNQTIFY